MTGRDDLKRTLSQLTGRNEGIGKLLERLRSGRQTDDARAKEAALQEEFDANQAIISKLAKTEA
jgi:hypothetical protein